MSPRSSFIALFRVINHYVGNLPPMPGVFYHAPVVRNDRGGRELVMMRWGMVEGEAVDPSPRLWRPHLKRVSIRPHKVRCEWRGLTFSLVERCW
jgi:hypothetical protein